MAPGLEAWGRQESALDVPAETEEAVIDGDVGQPLGGVSSDGIDQAEALAPEIYGNDAAAELRHQIHARTIRPKQAVTSATETMIKKR